MTEAENKVRMATNLLSTAKLLLEQAMQEGPTPDIDRALTEVTDAHLGLLVAQRVRVVATRARAEASR